jgi:hypothetical protein
MSDSKNNKNDPMSVFDNVMKVLLPPPPKPKKKAKKRR